jgi:manganese transport protein
VKTPERAEHPSLEGIHGTVPVPHHSEGFFRQWRAFVGPAILVSVGYMDPGNWGTDLQAGAQFKYNLLWVVLMASVMAIFMQVAPPGAWSREDLARACRDWYRAGPAGPWLLCGILIMACDLAGCRSAVALASCSTFRSSGRS